MLDSVSGRVPRTPEGRARHRIDHLAVRRRPVIAEDTGAVQTELTWIIDIYTLVMAGLLLPASANPRHPKETP